MRISPTTKAILLLAAIIVVWVGIGILIYCQTNPSAQTPATTQPTTTTATTSSTTAPASNLTQEEQNYIAELTKNSSLVVSAITSISQLITNPQVDNANWVSQATAQTKALTSLYNEMSQFAAPFSMFDIHYTYTYALSIYKSAADTIDQMIAGQDTTYIDLAVSYINSGTSLFTNSITMLNTFIAEKS